MLLSNYLKSLVLISIITVFISCKKESALIQKSITPLAVTNTSSNCKPVGLGMLATIPNQPPLWNNLMLKWYDGSNGKLGHVKAVFDFLYSNFQGFPNVALNLDYGEVTYDNDMVYLRDVFLNKVILRVKLDGMQRPTVSWYDGFFHGAPMTDTTHFYYSAGGALDSIHISYLIGTTPPGITFTYRCEYDSYNNLIHLTGPSGGNRVNFYYDYSIANPGTIPHYMVSVPLKLLECMDLLQFPHNNLLTSAVLGGYMPGIGYPDDTYPVYRWSFVSPRNNSTGQIYYYEDGIGYPDNGKFYSAWDCGTSNMVQMRNPTQSQFMSIVH
jgi:hypothetical protein